VLLLLVLGAACVGLRLWGRYGIRLTEGDSVWRLTYDITFHAAKAGTRLRVAVPDDGLHSRVFRKDLRYAGLDTERLRPLKSDTRELALVTERAGDFRVTARFDLHLSPRTTFHTWSRPAPLMAEERASFLRSTPTVQAEHPVVIEALRDLQAEVSGRSELVDKLFAHCYQQIGVSSADAPSDAVESLKRGMATPLGKCRAFVALCRAAKVPARLVAGLEVQTTGSQQSGPMRQRVWTEVLADNRWEPFDPEHGFARELPYTYLPARRHGIELVHAPNVTDLRLEIAQTPIPPPASMGRKFRQPTAILNLNRLPVEMHEVLELTLLMPVGALVTALFRTLIGIRTFGTFTPPLLALAFVFNDWHTGLVVFSVVILLGLLTRKLLDGLRLLMVPRLSVILTLVAVCIAFAVSLMEYLELTKSSQAVLLPMVICTMTVERFFLTSEEDSVRFALQLLAGTVVVGACCYLVLRWQAIGQFLLSFPEVHLFTVAALVLLGRYTGYRLTELWRFRDFARPSGG
jgi:transglutaminase-like putative cysteine protease